MIGGDAADDALQNRAVLVPAVDVAVPLDVQERLHIVDEVVDQAGFVDRKASAWAESYVLELAPNRPSSGKAGLPNFLSSPLPRQVQQPGGSGLASPAVCPHPC